MRHNLVDQPHVHRFLGVDHAAGEHQFHCFGDADRAGQPLSAAEARGDAQGDFRRGELGPLGGDADIAGEHHLGAAAEREAVDGRDGGLGQVLELVEHPVGPGGEGVSRARRHVLHLGDIGPGDE